MYLRQRVITVSIQLHVSLQTTYRISYPRSDHTLDLTIPQIWYLTSSIQICSTCLHGLYVPTPRATTVRIQLHVPPHSTTKQYLVSKDLTSWYRYPENLRSEYLMIWRSRVLAIWTPAVCHSIDERMYVRIHRLIGLPPYTYSNRLQCYGTIHPATDQSLDPWI